MSLIASKNEYRFVSVSQSILINGGILPNRCIWLDDYNGSQHPEIDAPYVMRGEDIAFLMEAVAERAAAASAYNYRSYSGGLYATMTNDIDCARIRSKIIGPLDGHSIYEDSRLNAYVSIPSELVKGILHIDTRTNIVPPSETSGSLTGISALHIGGRPTAESNTSDFVSSPTLKLEPINTLFRDIAKFRCFEVQMRSGGNALTGGASYKTIFYNKASVDSDNNGYDRRSWATGGCVYCQQAGIGAVQNEYKSGAFSLVDSCQAYLLIRTHHYEKADSSTPATNYYHWDLCFADCTKNDNAYRFEVPANTCVTIASKLRENHNITVRDSSFYGAGGSQTIEQTVEGSWGLFKLTDRTAVDELAWTWPPANA